MAYTTASEPRPGVGVVTWVFDGDRTVGVIYRGPAPAEMPHLSWVARYGQAQIEQVASAAAARRVIEEFDRANPGARFVSPFQDY